MSIAPHVAFPQPKNPDPTSPRTVINIGPQPGPQAQFQGSPADIAVFGGARGGGKSYGLLMEPLKHMENSGFGAVLFRRTYPEIFQEGGLWDTSEMLYPWCAARGSRGNATWSFPRGSTVSMRHMETEADRFAWLGAQVPLVGFDELATFTEKQFFFMLASNRSTCGVRPYIRCTTNPDADTWLAKFIQWWWDPNTGYAIPERAGVLRWFVRVNDLIEWNDSPEVLRAKHAGSIPKSVTFIPSKVYDNKILLERDPGYLSNLLALPTVDRERFLHGNWKIRPTAGLYFRREWFRVIPASDLPRSCHNNRLRYWDRAATEKRAENDPDFTCGIKMSRDDKGNYFVEHMSHFQASPGAVETSIKNTASQDGSHCHLYLEQDPAQAGKVEMYHLLKALSGFTVTPVPFTRKAKHDTVAAITHIKHGSSVAENSFKLGNPINVVEGEWNDEFFLSLEAFPEAPHDDIARSFGGCMNCFRDSKFQAQSVKLPRVSPEISELRKSKGLIW